MTDVGDSQPSFGDAKINVVCRYFITPRGCWRSDCKFSHSSDVSSQQQQQRAFGKSNTCANAGCTNPTNMTFCRVCYQQYSMAKGMHPCGNAGCQNFAPHMYTFCRTCYANYGKEAEATEVQSSPASGSADTDKEKENESEKESKRTLGNNKCRADGCDQVAPGQYDYCGSCYRRMKQQLYAAQQEQRRLEFEARPLHRCSTEGCNGQTRSRYCKTCYDAMQTYVFQAK